MQKPVIALDADGVIFNFLSHFSHYASNELNRKVRTLNHDWELDERFGLSKTELDQVWNGFNASGQWQHLPVYKGAVEAINVLSVVFDMYVVTSMPEEMVHFRRKALDKHGINLPIVTPGFRRSKRQIYEMLGASVVIDDYSAHLIEALDAGIKHRILIEPFKSAINTDSATHKFKSLNHAVDPMFRLLQEGAFYANSCGRSYTKTN